MSRRNFITRPTGRGTLEQMLVGGVGLLASSCALRNGLEGTGYEALKTRFPMESL